MLVNATLLPHVKNFKVLQPSSHTYVLFTPLSYNRNASSAHQYIAAGRRPKICVTFSH